MCATQIKTNTTIDIVSSNLKVLRKKKRLTQSELSKQLSESGYYIIDQKRYESWENARSLPPIDIMIAIVKFHGITLEILLTIDLANIFSVQ